MSPVILIDPGHGGQDPGATWPLVKLYDTYELVEKQVALEIGLMARGALLHSGLGVAVEMTRDEDEDLSLHARGMLAEKYGADLVLSLHVNASPSSADRGLMTFFWPGSTHGAHVAETISHYAPPEIRRTRNAIIEATDLPGTQDDWLIRARHVLGAYHPPCVLVEMGFATNEEDRDMLMIPHVRDGIVSALCMGVREFVSLPVAR